MSNSLVSVVVTCYNKRAYVAESLDSVIKQTYSPLELVIVDDGSTDGSRELLEDFAAHHDNVTLMTQPNQGVSAARNAGIRAAKGIYVMSLDADDLLEPTYVERCVEVLDEHSDVKVVQTRARCFGGREGEVVFPEYSYEHLLWSNTIYCCAMYRREDFFQTKGYNVNMQHGLEDWDFWLSLLKPQDKVVCVDSALFHYRVLPDSRSIDAEQYEMNCYQQIYNNHIDIYAPYVDRLVFFREKWAQYEVMCQSALAARQSKAYKIGKLITRPFGWIKRCFRKC